MVEMPGVPLPDDILTSDQHRIAAEDPLTVVVHHSKNCGFCKKFRPVAEEAGRAAGSVSCSRRWTQAATTGLRSRCSKGSTVSPATPRQGELLGIGYRDMDALAELLQEEVTNKI